MDVILALKKELKESFIKANMGNVFEAIPEDKEGDFIVGYTENYVKVYLPINAYDKIVKVKLSSIYGDGALGEVVR